MSALILLRHSLPETVPSVHPREWTLSEEGRRRCAALADLLAAYRPDVVVSSVETKAVETAELVAARLGVAIERAEGLHEHERGSEWLGRERFEQTIRELFERPAAPVFGTETALEARGRFAAALNRVLERRPGAVAAVTHGTVASLFVAGCERQDGAAAFALWRRLGLPSFLVLERPGLELREVVERIEG